MPPSAAAVLRETTFDQLPVAETTYTGPMPDAVRYEIEATPEAVAAAAPGPNPLIWGVAAAGALAVGASAIVLGAAVLWMADPSAMQAAILP